MLTFEMYFSCIPGAVFEQHVKEFHLSFLLLNKELDTHDDDLLIEEIVPNQYL